MPTVRFTANVTYGPAPLTVIFTNHSSGFEGADYTWNFGDGTTATTRNATHSFLAEGVFSVTLQAVSSGHTYYSSATIITSQSQALDDSYFAITKYNGVTVAPGSELFIYYADTNYKTDTWTDAGAGTTNPNPIVADANGKFNTQIFVLSGNEYKLVLRDPNGSTVISNVNNIINPQVGPGTHIYLTDGNTGVGAVNLNCIFPDPYHGHGETYMWWLWNTDSSPMDGSDQNDYVIVQKLPVTLSGSPMVEYLNNQMIFHRAGTYTITINLSYDPGATTTNWPQGSSVIGNHITGAPVTTPRNTSYQTRNSDGSGDSLDTGRDENFQFQSAMNMFTVSVAAGDSLQLNTFGYTGLDPSFQMYLQEMILVNRIGDQYTGGTP